MNAAQISALYTPPVATLLHTVVPAVSCYGLPHDEYHRRIDAAEDLQEQMQAQYNRPDGRYGREIMWHPAFADEYVASIGGTSLVEVAVIHQKLASYYNQGRPLDLIDYGYLRDLLAEALADNPTPLAALRLARALAWVEQAGAALLATQAAPPPSEAAPALSAAA
ncbi:hypothetical protein [Hymenobacter cheonanensis]|uniref:hypothetical protein n=1 Tax=Hymenobacter sp. CA2-7 TaxID=3063993 RepID=UPI002713BA54|nr:hypothetical protein [Hymenobacter sp. CA2-7]MDO7886007.1 hypothetical protein [Hymenobacter sp. CA2-7]